MGRPRRVGLRGGRGRVLVRLLPGSSQVGMPAGALARGLLSWGVGERWTTEESFKQGKGCDLGENGGRRTCRPNTVVKKREWGPPAWALGGGLGEDTSCPGRGRRGCKAVLGLHLGSRGRGGLRKEGLEGTPGKAGGWVCVAGSAVTRACSTAAGAALPHVPGPSWRRSVAS